MLGTGFRGGRIGPMPSLPLSISIISLNEEANLRRCLASVLDLASEIVILDSGSKDRTAEIAAEFGAQCVVCAIDAKRRADGSGTSFLFTNYLSKVSPDWKSRVGEGTAVNWPTGTGGKGNPVFGFHAASLMPSAISAVEYGCIPFS